MFVCVDLQMFWSFVCTCSIAMMCSFDLVDSIDRLNSESIDGRHRACACVSLYFALVHLISSLKIRVGLMHLSSALVYLFIYFMSSCCLSCI